MKKKNENPGSASPEGNGSDNEKDKKNVNKSEAPKTGDTNSTLQNVLKLLTLMLSTIQYTRWLETKLDTVRLSRDYSKDISVIKNPLKSSILEHSPSKLALKSAMMSSLTP